MPPELVFELGLEELPAAFVDVGLRALSVGGEALLTEARLSPTGVRAVGTPRRLALCVQSLAERQPDVSEVVVGPPARVAFGEDGQPTKAAIGFAKKNGAEVSSLSRGEAPGKKGEYVLCERKEAGRKALEVVPAILEALMAEIPWPKSMRWGAGLTVFARPVHWLVALLGGECLPVSFAGITAGSESRGHRFLHPGPVPLKGTYDDYTTALRQAFVIVAPEERQNVVRAELRRVEKDSGVRIREDEGLVLEVANLVEYPVGIAGGFDRSFLEVPEEVIVSAMRSHQRYFATEDADKKLAPTFVTIAGTVVRDKEVVRAGNERVLAARLADAQFFYKEDRKTSLAEMSKKLSGVVFQKALGTVAAKVTRIVSLAERIATATGASAEDARQAASLCKADLVSHMVYEFPELQGLMGRYYALAHGVTPAVAEAIEQHYWPKGSGSALPTSDVGAVVALADRMDTLVGCFAAGLAPSGSADPYGLRRAALGVLAILMDRDWSSLSLAELVDWASATLPDAVDAGKERARVLEFLRVRLRGVLEGDELAGDCIEAALSAGFFDVPDAAARAKAVARLRARTDFEPLAAAFKRVANILKGGSAEGAPDPDVFVEDDEKALWASFVQIQERVTQHLGGRDYDTALNVLSELKAPVDKFFESVLVMDKDQRIRDNRLAMLGRINATFNQIADFRQLSV